MVFELLSSGISRAHSSSLSNSCCVSVTLCKHDIPKGRLPRLTGVLGGILRSKNSGERTGPNETLFRVLRRRTLLSPTPMMSLTITLVCGTWGEGVGSADSGIDMREVDREDT